MASCQAAVIQLSTLSGAMPLSQMNKVTHARAVDWLLAAIRRPRANLAAAASSDGVRRKGDLRAGVTTTEGCRIQ
jgi:hypothetical protein